MIGINQLKSGVVIRLDGKLYSVLECDHVKPGKGAAFTRTKVRNLEAGNVLERTFRASDKIEDVFIEEKTLQFLYTSGGTYHFMDLGNYEQVTIDKENIGKQVNFLKENMEISVLLHEQRVVQVVLPTSVELKIEKTDPGLRGDTAKPGTKPAILETGAVVQVPLFMQAGDKIKVDTRTGAYMERA